MFLLTLQYVDGPEGLSYVMLWRFICRHVINDGNIIKGELYDYY